MMSIEDDARKVLLALGSYEMVPNDPERGQHRLEGARLAAVTGLNGNVLKDAVDVLDARGLLHRARTVSDQVGYIKLNAKGRLEAEKLTAGRASSQSPGSSGQTSADDIPKTESWGQRWWRVPGESFLDEKPIDGKVVSARFTWCHEDEWGVVTMFNGGKAELIFRTDVSKHDGQPCFADTDNAPDYVVRVVGGHLMRRLSRCLRDGGDDPILAELAKQFAIASWVSGVRLRRATGLKLEEFHRHIEKLTPRYVRKELTLDSARDSYGLTLPGLLHADARLGSVELVEKIYRAIAHRFRADPDAEVFDRTDLVAVGMKEPDLNYVGRVAEVCLLIAAHPDTYADAFRLPADSEPIAEAVGKHMSFRQYLVEAASDGARSEHYPVKRPWPTAPLWLQRDGSQPHFVPSQLFTTPTPRSWTSATASTRTATSVEPERFEVGELLGEGVYAEVYRARDTMLNRAVALKFVRPDVAGNNALEHARALARVQHPNIVTVHEVIEVAHPISGAFMPTVVMELVEGISLTERIGSPIDRDELRRIGDALLGAITAYHANNFAHLDLHDHNVIVGHPVVKVLDAIYFDTAALSSTATRTAQQAKDVRSVRDIIEQMLYSGGVSTEVAVQFLHSTARRDLTLAALRVAFNLAVPQPKQVAVRPPVEVELHGSVVMGHCDEQGEHCSAKDVPDAVEIVEVGRTHRQLRVCKQCLDEALSTGRWQLRQ